MKTTKKPAKPLSRYFPHDVDSCARPEIISLQIKCSLEGYGIYWRVMELLRLAQDFSLPLDYKMLRFNIKVSEKKIKSVIEDFDLFVIDYENQTFSSKDLTFSMEIMENISKKRSDAGKKGNAKRWAEAHNTLDLQPLTNSEATKNVSQCDRNLSLIKENKIKENKIKENKREYLNSPPPNLNEESAAAAFEMVDLSTPSSVLSDIGGTDSAFKEASNLEQKGPKVAAGGEFER